MGEPQILALKLAFAFSGADPEKQNKWSIAANYWQKRGLLGLDKTNFKRVTILVFNL